MAGNLAVALTIGASLASGFTAAIGGAVQGIGQVGNVAAGVGGALGRAGNGARDFGAETKRTEAHVEGLNVELKKNQALAEAGSRIKEAVSAFGTAIAGGAVGKQFADQVGQAMDFDATLRKSARSVGVYGADVAELGRKIRVAALDSRVSAESMGAAFDALVRGGVGKDEATAMLGDLSKAAKAAGAPIDAVGRIAAEMRTKLGVPIGDVKEMFGQLVVAGEAGGVRIDDLAASFPRLAAAAKSLGIGKAGIADFAAMMNVATREGGLAADEAARQVTDFASKINSPEMRTRLENAGVNVRKVLREATAAGENPLSAIFRDIDRVAKIQPGRSRAEILGEMFPEAATQDFMRAMVDHLDVVGAQADKARNKARGAIDAINAQGGGDAGSIKRLGTAFDALGLAIGDGLLKPLGAMASVVAPVVEWIAKLATTSPMTTTVVAGLGLALSALPAVLAAVKLGTLAAAAGFRVMGLAAVANPVGATIAALAIGAALIIDNWKTISDAFRAGWEPVADFFAGFWDPIKPVWESLTGWVGEIWEKIRAPFEAVGRLIGGISARGVGQAVGQKMAGLLGDGTREPGLVAAQRDNGEVRVKVDFTNLPRGAEIEKERRGDVGLDLSAGYAWIGA